MLDWPVRVSQTRQEQLGSDPTRVIQRLVDGGQSDIIRHFQIIETNDRQITGNFQSQLRATFNTAIAWISAAAKMAVGGLGKRSSSRTAWRVGSWS